MIKINVEVKENKELNNYKSKNDKKDKDTYKVVRHFNNKNKFETLFLDYLVNL